LIIEDEKGEDLKILSVLVNAKEAMKILEYSIKGFKELYVT